MNSTTCQMVGCTKPAVLGGLAHAMERFGIRNYPDVMRGDQFAFCVRHLTNFAAHVAIERGLLDPAALDAMNQKDRKAPAPGRKAPILGIPTTPRKAPLLGIPTTPRKAATPAPVKHYPAGSDARIMRLVEIEESMRRPARAATPEREPAPRLQPTQGGGVGQRRRLWEWLMLQGENPIKRGNWG